MLYKTHFELKKPTLVVQLDLTYFPFYNNYGFVNPNEESEKKKQIIVRRKTLDKFFTPENMKALENIQQENSKNVEISQTVQTAKQTYYTDEELNEMPKKVQPEVQKLSKATNLADNKILFKKDSIKAMQTMTKFTQKLAKADLLSEVSNEKDKKDYEDLKFTDKTNKTNDEDSKSVPVKKVEVKVPKKSHKR